jgi:integral membrane sensor domain MASE1
MVSRSRVPKRSSAPAVYQAVGNAVSLFLTPANLWTFLILAVSYFITGKFGQELAVPHPDATAVWLPTGISLAVVLLKGNRVWPGIFVGAFLVNVTRSGAVLLSMAIAVGNTLEAVAGAYLVKRFASGSNAFFRARDVLRFVVLAGMIPTALCATVGAGLLCMSGLARWGEFRAIWPVWWVGDVFGALLLTPFLVLLFGHRHHSLGPMELVEATVMLIGLCVVGAVNFGPHFVPWAPKAGLLYLSLPFLVWVALRFCPLEAAGANLLMSGFAVWGSLHGYGPYGNVTGAPLLAAGYVAVASTMTMVIAAASAEHREYAENVLRMHNHLKEKKDEEIRLLQDTVTLLQIELKKSELKQPGRPPEEDDV